MTEPATSLPDNQVRPRESDAFRLAASIVALGDGPWSPSALLGQPALDLTRHDLPSPGSAAATPPVTPLVVPEAAKSALPRRFAGLGKTVEMRVGDLSLTFTMANGSWEPSTGNAPPRRDEPRVVGITLSGPGGIPSPAPDDAVVTEVMADDSGGASTEMTKALVWGRSLTFAQGTAERPFRVTRFVGRAPFQYSRVEQRNLEDALIAVTTAMTKGPVDLQALVGAQPGGAAIDPPPPRAVAGFHFGAGTVAVHSGSLVVQCTGPMRLPRLWSTLGVSMLTTSFAHNLGTIPATIELPGLDLSPAYSFSSDPPRAGAARMGDAANARIWSLSIVARPERYPSAASRR